MCLGLPGRVVAVPDDGDLVDVDVAGVVRQINVALLDGPWHPGEWILIHSGFALERMSADEAADAVAVLGGGPSPGVGLTGAGWGDTPDDPPRDAATGEGGDARLW